MRWGKRILKCRRLYLKLYIFFTALSIAKILGLKAQLGNRVPKVIICL